MLNEFRSTHITWDKATRRIYSPVTANESDENGRKLVVQIVNGGQVEDLTGTALHLYWETRDKLHDGLDVFEAVDLKKGEFELSYTTGMLSNRGVLNANLVLIDTVGRVVSDQFKITVTEGIDNDAIQSENSFSSLTQALIDISNLEQNYAPRLNDLTAQLQQIALDVKSVGAKGDGVTDDTLAIQHALDTANTVIISAGTYLIDGTRVTIDNYGDDTVTGLLARSNQTIVFEDGATLKVIPNNSEWYAALSFHEVHNVTVKNGIIIGERDEHDGTTGEWGYGYNVVSSENIRFVDCLAKDFWGDGFLIGCTNHLIPETRSENIHLINCVAKNNRRQGLSATGAIGLLIEGGEYSGTNGTEPASGIDLEPNSTATRVENVQLLGVKMINNAIYGLMATTVKNLKVDKCVFYGNGRASIYTPVEIDMLVTGCVFDDPSIIAMSHAEGGPVYKKQIDFIDNTMTIKTRLEYLEGVTPFLTGSLNFIRNRIVFKSGCNTSELTASPNANELSFFNENTVTIEPSFDAKILVLGKILLYPGNPNIQLADNTLLNKSEATLTLDGSQGFYGKPNRYIGLITDQGGKVNGDLKSVLIDMATIAPGGYGVVEIPHIGVKVGDTITLTASSNSHRFYLNAQCLVNGVITIQAYNVTDTAHTLNMPVRLDIQRFYS